jgi:crotonobetainyl-CoA:carnitine CoA-transferase CaiB-like acyl-CoA transferase
LTYSLLQGLRVVELGESVSAPYCAKLLADMGAEVIKMERPGVGDQAREYGPFPGDEPHHERSGLFLYLNANKQGVTLDLETPTGREILGDLLAQSQVFVHNLHPKEMDRLSVDYEHLSKHNEQLVMASITPFGLTGPYRNYKAYDINLAAAGGICEGLGSPDREPLTFGTPQVGYFAAMAAASSIVIALLAGSGQHIDIAEVEAMAGIYNGPEALMAVYQWRVTRRTGHHALDFPYPNCILRCKDGYIFVGSPEGRQWRGLLELMGNPPWAREPRLRNRTVMNNEYADEVDGYVEEWLLKHTKGELLEMALEHRLPLAPVRGFDEVRSDPSLTSHFVTIDRADTGQVAYPGTPFQLTGLDSLPPAPAPTLGQHNRDVYCGRLGYTPEELVKLHQTGII